jgi:molybdenum cofactor biosynthesis protein A
MSQQAATKITDNFERVHDYLRISLTERCNLRCHYCMPEDGIPLKPETAYMSASELVEIARIFTGLGVRKIRLTGGEPLLRKDFASILNMLSELPVELAITTNGLLIDRYIDDFTRYGLRSVNVSLDTLDKNRFKMITRRDDFERTYSNINLLIEKKFHVKINAVIIKDQNEDEIRDFIEFTKYNPVHFRFIEFMPFDGNNWNLEKCVSYNEMISQVAGIYGDDLLRLTDRKNDTSKNYKIRGYKGTFAVISSVTNPFCDSCNRIRITADGKMKNCLFSGAETDLLQAHRNGNDIVPLILGSIKNKKYYRNGLSSLSDFSNPEEHLQNRAMVAIGG